jgi:hypothetical protein
MDFLDDKGIYHPDYSSPNVPESIKLLKPVIRKDGDAFCILYGPAPEEGIFGCGDTPEEAMKDFDEDYKRHIGGKAQ